MRMDITDILMQFRIICNFVSLVALFVTENGIRRTISWANRRAPEHEFSHVRINKGIIVFCKVLLRMTQKGLQRHHQGHFGNVEEVQEMESTPFGLSQSAPFWERLVLSSHPIRERYLILYLNHEIFKVYIMKYYFKKLKTYPTSIILRSWFWYQTTS